MEKKKVLIIDSDPANIAAARKQFRKLKNVQLTFIRSFDEFDEKFRQYIPTNNIGNKKNAITQFDVVLTDMFMPPTDVVKSDKESPCGISIASFAKDAGVKHVGIVTTILDHNRGFFEWSRNFISVLTLDLFINSAKTDDEVHEMGELGTLLPIFDARIKKLENNQKPVKKGWILVYEYLVKNETK